MGQMNNNRPVMATTPGATYGSSSGQAVSPFQVSQMTPTVAQTPQSMPASATAPTATPQQNYITDKGFGFNTFNQDQVTLFGSQGSNPLMRQQMQTIAQRQGESAQSLSNMIGYAKAASGNYVPVWQKG